MTKTKRTSKQIIKAWLRTALLALVAAVLGLSIYHVNASRLAGDAVPMPFGFGVAVILSGSMEPELSTGDLVFIRQRDAYGIGDVVVYQDGSMSVTHRIIGTVDGMFITRGDANNTSDAPIYPEQIKGEVTGSVPIAGYIVSIIKTPLGTLSLLGIAILLLTLSFRSEKKQGQQELDAIRDEIRRLREQQND